MRLHRFFIKAELEDKALRITDSELVEQWRNVLRLKDGAKILLFNGNGSEAEAEIIALGKAEVKLRIVKNWKNENEPSRHVVLYCSVLKRENFELVAQKATEAGVYEIVPIVAERTEKLNLRLDRLERIAKEAAEQSGRATVPMIRKPVKFLEALEQAKENEANFIFDPKGGELAPNPVKSLRDNGARATGIWIGPEGGWTEEELALAEKAGFKKASLGRLTLRAETAAIVASYLVTNH